MPTKHNGFSQGIIKLSHKGRGRRRLVLERGGNGTRGLVVARETVNTRLDKNETELAVGVLAVALKVLAHGDGTLLRRVSRNHGVSTYNEVVEVLRDLRGETLAPEDTENLVTSDVADLGDTLAVTKLSANLRRRHTLTRQLDNLLDDLLGRRLQPRGRRAAVRQSRLGDTLTLRMHATHGVCLS